MGAGSELANKIADIPWFGVGNAVICSWRNRPIRDLLELSCSLRIGWCIDMGCHRILFELPVTAHTTMAPALSPLAC